MSRPEGCVCDYGPNTEGPDEFCPVHGRRCTFNPETTCAAIIDAPNSSGHCCRDYDQYAREVARLFGASVEKTREAIGEEEREELAKDAAYAKQEPEELAKVRVEVLADLNDFYRPYRKHVPVGCWCGGSYV